MTMAESKAAEATLDKGEAEVTKDRRELLKSIPWLGIAWGALAAAVGGLRSIRRTS